MGIKSEITECLRSTLPNIIPKHHPTATFKKPPPLGLLVQPAGLTCVGVGVAAMLGNELAARMGRKGGKAVSRPDAALSFAQEVN